MKKLIIILVILAAAISSTVAAQTYKVIVNTSNDISSLSHKDLALVFLKKQKRWDDGSAIQPIDQKANAPVRSTFSTEVFRKKVDAIRSYWQQAIFSGMATAPIEKDTDEDVVEYVKNNKGAIGYISANTPVSGVKVISITN